MYHAGSFADVHKHAVLVQVLKTLRLKKNPVTVMDTHAGRGIYDLLGSEAQKTGECQSGVFPLWTPKIKTSPITEYMNILHKHNPEGELRTYPGSPMVIQGMLRESDHLICIEKHPGEFQELQACFKNFPTVTLKQADGFQALADMTTPAGHSSLVLIDPSYEIKSEYAELPKYLERAWKKWPQAIFMIWYPLLPDNRHAEMLLKMRQSSVRDVLVSEVTFETPPKGGFAMRGSGLAIVNPPWPREPLDALTQYIASCLKAAGHVFWLDNMKIEQETGALV